MRGDLPEEPARNHKDRVGGDQGPKRAPAELDIELVHECELGAARTGHAQEIGQVAAQGQGGQQGEPAQNPEVHRTSQVRVQGQGGEPVPQPEETQLLTHSTVYYLFL